MECMFALTRLRFILSSERLGRGGGWGGGGEEGGKEQEAMLTLREQMPSAERLKRGSNHRCCITQDSDSQHTAD